MRKRGEGPKKKNHRNQKSSREKSGFGVSRYKRHLIQKGKKDWKPWGTKMQQERKKHLRRKKNRERTVHRKTGFVCRGSKHCARVKKGRAFASGGYLNLQSISLTNSLHSNKKKENTHKITPHQDKNFN